MRGRRAARSPSLVAAGGQRARVGEELTLTIGLEDREPPSFTAAPRVEVAMSRAGAVRVRLNLWLVYSPNALGAGPITWQSDGTPVVPGAALWSGRLDLEHTIHVDP